MNTELIQHVGQSGIASTVDFSVDGHLQGLVLEKPSRRTTPSILPWQNRGEEEWRTSVKRNEAVRLLYLASKSNGNPSSPDNGYFLQPPSWIKEWRLSTPFEVYWNNDLDTLFADMNVVASKDSTYYPEGDIDKVAAVLTDSFAQNGENKEAKPYQYLMAVRNAMRDGKKHNLHEEVAKALNYTHVEMADLLAKYQSIIKAFHPFALRRAHSLSKKRLIDPEEAEGIAGVTLTSAVAHFYWETVAIDPRWTTNRFLGTLLASMKDRSRERFDAQVLAISLGSMDIFQEPSLDPEEEAMKNTSETEVQQLIANNTKNSEEAAVLSLRINDNLYAPAIARELGIPEERVVWIIDKFRKKLRPKKGENKPDASQKKHLTFFDNLFTNLEKYKRYFNERRKMLRPFHEMILEKFFELQTGDKKSSLFAVQQYFKDQGKDIKITTIRRHICAGINILDHKEEHQYRTNDRLNNGWSKYQETLLVCGVMEDPNIWDTFSEQTKYILIRYYKDGQGRTGMGVKIAEELGLNQSTVSRARDRALMAIYKSRGDLKSEDSLISKSRQLLPK